MHLNKYFAYLYFFLNMLKKNLKNLTYQIKSLELFLKMMFKYT